MKNAVTLSFLVVTGILAVFFTGTLSGSPRLITDNRVENLNGHPSIGRGYNIHSNTLQSVCFNKVVKTRPTFDLNYELDEVTGDFFSEVPQIGKERLGNVNIHFFVKKYFKQREVEQRQVHQLKNMLVRLVIRNYYYSLDETKSILSNSARQLLSNEEYVTFFNSCGQHYVKSIGSFSSYLALLQYRLTGNTVSDMAFVASLEKGLFNFSGDAKIEKTFTRDAVARGMRVYVQAIGLSKGELVNLIPVDVNQFRLTIQDTVKLMQDADAGLVRYIEVVPWVENPELSTLLTERMRAGGEQFIKLQRLEANSGVITEINRISNSQVEQFYIASMCEKILFEKYMDKSNRKFYENITGQTDTAPTVLFLTDIIEQKTLSYDMEKTMFYNLANVSQENVFISLREYIEYFARNPPYKLFDENRQYLYGDGKDPGAINCIDELYKGGLEKVDYRTIPSCVKALKHIRTQSFFLSQYCLPKPARLVFKGTGSQTGKKEQTPTPKQRRDADSSVYGTPTEAGGKSSAKPKSLEDLVGDKKQEPQKTEKSQGSKKPTSLQDLLKEGDSGATEPPVDELIDKQKEITPIIRQELSEGEKEAARKIEPRTKPEPAVKPAAASSGKRKVIRKRPGQQTDPAPRTQKPAAKPLKGDDPEQPLQVEDENILRLEDQNILRMDGDEVLGVEPDE